MLSTNNMDNPVLDDINPAELEAPIPESKWRRQVLIIIAVFIAILVASLSFFDIVQSIIQSKTVEGNKLVFPNAAILFENNTLQQLQKEFIANEHREIKACLFGSQDNETYIISSAEFPEVIRANVLHIVSVPCPVDTLIDLHSHPINQCLASDQDLFVYTASQQNNPNLRMMIMCSSTRFALI